MQSSQNSLYSIIDQIRIRKAMYLGNSYTFNSLESFISGFTFAASVDQLDIEGGPNFNYFNTWILGHIENHFGLSGGWHWQIKNRNKDDDNRAFEDFFQLLEIFKKSKITRRTLIVDQAAIEYSKLGAVKRYNISENKTLSRDENPSKIVSTKLSNSSTIWIDYIGENGRTIHDYWEIGYDKAMKRLATEFGPLKNEWIEDS